MKYEQTRENFFQKYHETRTIYLDKSDEDKMEWFTFYFKTLYAPYFEKVSHQSAILELGCNKGYLLKIFENQGYLNLTGVDLSEGDLAIAKKTVLSATMIQEDIFTFLEKTQKKFDVIILKALIEHIPKDRIIDLLQAIYERLNPGGFVFIDVFNAAWIFSQHDRYMDFTHELGFTHESLQQVMNFVFDKINVQAYASPVFMRKRRRWLYYLSRRLFKTFMILVEPEMRETPFMERLLIAQGMRVK